MDLCLVNKSLGLNFIRVPICLTIISLLENRAQVKITYENKYFIYF